MDKSTEEIIVPIESNAERLDVFLAKHFEISRAKSREFILSGGLGRGHKPGNLVSEGQRFRLERELLREVRARKLPLAEKQLQVVYEDPHLLIVDKPRGLHSIRLRMEDSITLADCLVSYLPELASVGEDQREAGLVHRLDFHTGGLLLVAKTTAVLSSLREAFSRGDVYKEYQAIVEGSPSVGILRCAIDARKSKRVKTYDCFSEESRANAEESLQERVFEEVELELLKVLDETSDTSGCVISHIELGGGSMRRHQVRAMMAHAGHPLLGDTLYGAVLGLEAGKAAALGIKIGEAAEEAELDGFYLVASRLKFKHPISGEALDIVKVL